MKLTLIHPPLDDPTVPYHSTAYLKGHLAANGFDDVTLRDVNIEYVNWLLRPDTVAAMNERAAITLESLRRSSAIGFEEQEQYGGLLAAGRCDPADLSRAASELRNRESFLDFRRYVDNVGAIGRYLAMLGALSYPAQHSGFAHITRGRYSPSSMQDLLDPGLGDRVCMPFNRYFEESIANDPDFADADLFGIGIVYDHQIYHAFQFSRLLKRLWPEKRLVFGGAAVSQLYKYLKDKTRIKEVFALCDAIVIGEGETAICEMAASDGDLERGGFTNTISYCKDSDRLSLPAIRYENLTALGRPVYDHPWDLYLSPERGINYSPTRGCYWNRCTFCDYGLNSGKPTSPWRERGISQVVDDLEHVQRRYGVRYVYFAVDAMAPGYLERLADAICHAGLEIRWGAELRPEKIFSGERARKMAQAGCVCVSFGIESGSQRILNLIDKGTNVGCMSATIRNFASAGVACQLMAFTGFPTETPAEREATLELIRETEPYWSAGGIGTFLLTAASIIARNPARFGIAPMETEGADVARSVAYSVNRETGLGPALTEGAGSSFDRTGGAFPDILGRPWAGSIDSLHTTIYYAHHGPAFFKLNPPKAKANGTELQDQPDRSSEADLDGQLVEANFDLAEIVANRQLFAEYLDGMRKVPAEPTYAAFAKWARDVPPLQADAEASYWLLE